MVIGNAWASIRSALRLASHKPNLSERMFNMTKKNSTIEWVEIAQLDLSENLRGDVDPVSIQPLVESLRNVGMLQPILVRKNESRLIVEDGSRRLLAAKFAGWTQVPVRYVDEQETASHSVQRQLIANQQREALPPTILAKGVFELMEGAKCTAKEAAALIGMSTKVGKLSRMMRLPEELLSLIDAGKIPASCGYYLSRVEDSAKQAELASQVVAGKLTRDALQRVVSAMSPTNLTKAKSAMRKTTLNLAGNQTVTVSAPGLNLATMISILEGLLKRAKQERKRDIELDTFVNMLHDQSQKAKA
jgi:ParB family chromosome partitioning protein